MRRTVGTAAFVLPLVALALGPWLGLGTPSSSAGLYPSGWFAPYTPAAAQRADLAAPIAVTRGNSACNCRTVELNLNNDVRDAEVKTGDSRVINFNVTYVSAAYGDREVDVDQEAEAVSGDAIAGQLIAVDARGPGCVNVRVTASNHVEDTTVESGDATAINRSVVLLDPGVNRGDLEIDVEQEAEAHSGDAIAGQVIGLVGGGRVGRCGGAVDLKAVNEVLRTDVETGKALTRNHSVIQTCAVAGCAAELRALLGSNADLEVCSGSRCREVDDAEELSDVLKEAGERTDPEGETHEVADPAKACESGTPTAHAPAAEQQPKADGPSPEPTPQPESSPQSATAAPSPSPGASPAPCPTPAPSPNPAAEIMASGSESTPAPGT